MTAVWVQLYIGDEKAGGAFKIQGTLADLSELKEGVKEKRKNALAHVDASELTVYPSGTVVPLPEDAVPLNAWDVVPGGSSGPSPLIVVAPQQQQPNANQQQKWYHVTGSISRPKSHAGARRQLFKFASDGGLYPQGRDANTAFEPKTSPSESEHSILSFSVVFKSDNQAAQFVNKLSNYLRVNEGELQLRDDEGDALERPRVSEIPPYPTTVDKSFILQADYKPQNGDTELCSPVIDVVMETRSADFSVDVTVLSTRDDVFRFQRIENSTSFILADAESAHIVPSAKCSETYEWLDDKPYNRLALSRDFHLNFDGTARGQGKRRKTVQAVAIRPKRPDDGFRTCEFEGVLCYEIPLELIVYQNDKAEALLAKLGNNSQLHRNATTRWTIDGADVRIFYPKSRWVVLVAEPTEDMHLDLVTAVPGVTDLSECWSQAADTNPLSLEAAEVLEKCLLWNYENALVAWSKLG